MRIPSEADRLLIENNGLWEDGHGRLWANTGEGRDTERSSSHAAIFGLFWTLTPSSISLWNECDCCCCCSREEGGSYSARARLEKLLRLKSQQQRTTTNTAGLGH
ncbi:hypothetical protein JOB18_009452 [Solea senegalensis]|uniref:Uncharacterized protein n=1 Tax=Solea senegalensis TaxID=28829 RepID=A0AAV6SEI5_SOLSE|nr:hypothetical protein JOB18_009452 [Solea senegalensis]